MTEYGYEFIDNAAAWRVCLARLREEPRVALDLEANSLYAYRESVCLIQASVAGHDFIIDPLADFDLAGLGKLLADPKIEKIFHASEYDLMLLKRHYDWEVANLFDTMWAGRILGYRNMGLAAFLGDFYGVEISKRYQKADWGKRPLSEGQLDYAQMDTHYLLRLRDDMAQRLEDKGLIEEAREIFAQECEPRQPSNGFDPEGFWSIRGARDLKPQSQAILRALYMDRDREAKRRNVPPFKVVSNAIMVLLAKHAPCSLAAMHRLDGLSKKVADRMGRRLLKAIDEGRGARPPKRPKRPPRRPDDVVERYNALLEWRKATAQARDVESDVVLTRDQLWSLAESNPKTKADVASLPLLGSVRHALYAHDIVQVLSGDA